MLSVLIVDDQVQVRQLIRNPLEGARYHVEEARDGKEGLARYHEQSADLVLMDVLMPDQDGLGAITALRRKLPRCSDHCGTDGIDVPNFLDVATMVGTRRTLQKPFELQALLDAVATEVMS